MYIYIIVDVLMIRKTTDKGASRSLMVKKKEEKREKEDQRLLLLKTGEGRHWHISDVIIPTHNVCRPENMTFTRTAKRGRHLSIFKWVTTTSDSQAEPMVQGVEMCGHLITEEVVARMRK